MKRVKDTVATHCIKEGEEIVYPIKEAGSSDIFVKTNVTNEDVIRSLVKKPAKTYVGIVFAFDNTGREEMMTPVFDQKSGRVRSTVFETMKSMHLIGGVGNPAKAAIGLFSDKASCVPDGEFIGPTNTLQK
jgi:hypothetical protein